MTSPGDLNKRAALEKRLRYVDALLKQKSLFDQPANVRFLQGERQWIEQQLRRLAA